MELRNLPEDLAREIVWRTSPVDTVKLATLSKWLKYVADSNVVWEKFVPFDWAEMVSSKSKSSILSKKELFVSLCLNPIFSDDGKLGFYVDKRSGNKCYFVVARGLMCALGCLFTRIDSSSTEVIEIRSCGMMDIRGKIKGRILSPNIVYGAYMVYKLFGGFKFGLRALNAVVRVVHHETQSEAETRAAVVHLVLRSSTRSTTQSVINANFPVTRDDGWLEILLGTFYNHPRYHGDEIEARLMDLKFIGGGHDSFFVKAIYFRPL